MPGRESCASNSLAGLSRACQAVEGTSSLPQLLSERPERPVVANSGKLRPLIPWLASTDTGSPWEDRHLSRVPLFHSCTSQGSTGPGEPGQGSQPVGPYFLQGVTAKFSDQGWFPRQLVSCQKTCGYLTKGSGWTSLFFSFVIM